MKPTFFIPLILCLMMGLAACDSGGDPAVEEPEEMETGCIVPTAQLFESTAIDAIPALTDPALVDAATVDYLDDEDLVLGLRVGTLIVAVPNKLLNWHEVVNFNTTDPQLAVTFCPLSGSGLAFDRAAIGTVPFGVSGLIYQNNNVLFDRRSNNSLWSQMESGAICGDASGASLTRFPLLEMTWAGWRALYPDTQVLSANTGFDRNYAVDPLRLYKEPDNPSLNFDMPGGVDPRRPPKERVLGLPDGRGGLAFPFQILDDGSPFRVIRTSIGANEVVVFWDRDRAAAAAYRLTGSNAGRSFDIRNDQIIDAETESVWRIDGEAESGPLAGQRLAPVADAYVAYWFAWAAFQPETEIWGGN